MGPSPSFFENHEFLDVFLQPLSFKQKAECHVQGSSGKYTVAKPRPMNLVSRNLPSADSSDPNFLVNQEADQSCVSSSGRKLTRNINQNTTMYSQEKQQDDTQSSSTTKLGRRDELSSSASARKQERGEDIQIGRSQMEFHSMQISDHRYLETVFNNVRKS